MQHNLPVIYAIFPANFLNAKIHVGLRELVFPVWIRVKRNCSKLHSRLIQCDLLFQLN